MDGTAELELLLGEQQAHLALSAKLSTDARETDVRARITPVVPSVLARAAPSLAFLAVLDAPVDAEPPSMLDAGLGLREARFSVHVGAGTVRIGPSDVPFVDAALVASSEFEHAHGADVARQPARHRAAPRRTSKCAVRRNAIRII